MTKVILLCCVTALSVFAAEPRPRLIDFYGKRRALEHFKTDDTKALVLIYMNTYCPILKRYLPKLLRMEREYRAKGVQFLGVYSNQTTDVRSMTIHAHEGNLTFPVVLDVEARLAKQLGAERTPEAMLLSPDLKVVYRGAIDDQFAQGILRPEAKENYLLDAINDFLQTQSVRRPETVVEGCLIEMTPPTASRSEVTYHQDVAPILEAKCQSCHRPGQIGPFPLMNYEQARSNSRMIAEVTRERRMPPWNGVPNDSVTGKFLGDLSLSREEIDTLSLWAAMGAPEGSPTERPIKQWPDPEEWTIGKPDFTYQMEKPFNVPAEGVLDYQFFRVKLRFPEDRWVRAIEVRPGNRAVVHHMELHLVPQDDAKTYEGLIGLLELYGLDGAPHNLVASYTPGDTYSAKVFKPNQAVRIPKRHDIILEVHYTTNGVAARDASQLGFIFAQGPPKQEVKAHVFRKPRGGFLIPAGDPNHRMEQEYWFKNDVEIFGVRAHMHNRGKSYRLEKLSAEGNWELVFSIPRWDFNWQRTYEFERPLRLKAGEILRGVAYFDNSRFNPSNPDPKRDVPWGVQSWDEMFSSRIIYRDLKEEP